MCPRSIFTPSHPPPLAALKDLRKPGKRNSFKGFIGAISPGRAGKALSDAKGKFSERNQSGGSGSRKSKERKSKGSAELV